jgi:hypothetical protein
MPHAQEMVHATSQALALVPQDLVEPTVVVALPITMQIVLLIVIR